MFKVNLSFLSSISNALNMYFDRVIAYLLSRVAVSCLSNWSGFSSARNFKITRNVSFFKSVLVDFRGGLSSHRARCFSASPPGAVLDFLNWSSSRLYFSACSCLSLFLSSLAASFANLDSSSLAASIFACSSAFLLSIYLFIKILLK